MFYSILFSYYEVSGEEERLIEEHKLHITDNKESLEALLKQLNYHFIGNDDLWGFRSNNFMGIAEIISFTEKE
ncbi:hypothetical protein [Niallia sp. BSM11]|uniref:hypothetical protein n=1 Tax=Niallia sp. BSM11 TaxID=3391576 RepID=UPI003984EBC1